MSNLTVPIPVSGGTFKTYHGVTVFDIHGQLLAETGAQNSPKQAQERIDKLLLSLRGKWAFGITKHMTQDAPTSREIWRNAILFPDGKSRPIAQGEVAIDTTKPKPQGIWLTSEAVRKVYPKVKVAPALKFPYLQSFLECRQYRFESMIEFEQKITEFTNTLFVVDPPSDIELPIEKGLYIYMVHAPK